jgi:hypothetical protein
MGRTGSALEPSAQTTGSVYYLGVQFVPGAVYATDMLFGLWRFAPP